MSRRKSLITWKDADQNLCTIAALILDDANLLRSPDDFNYAYQVEGAEPIQPGYAEDSGSRSVFSTEGGFVQSNDFLSDAIGDFRPTPAPLCWYSFQNLVRLHLKKSRKELKDNLYQQKDPVVSSKQESRNPVKRRSISKYGRKGERT